LWVSSIRKANRRGARENALAWQMYHESQARSHEYTLRMLVSHHRAEAEKYRRMLEAGDVPEPELKLAAGVL
jgi:hypothetical protein